MATAAGTVAEMAAGTAVVAGTAAAMERTDAAIIVAKFIYNLRRYAHTSC
jgi:hypothetical protein